MKTELSEVLKGSAVDLASILLGAILERHIDDKIIRVRIVELEAYTQIDAASHSFKGRTHRTEIMFGPPGHLYVYFTYGMHYCCNIVTGEIGVGEALLIRAVEPILGEDILRTYRPKNGVEITNGPAKLCQALQIDKQLNGHDLTKQPLKLILQPPLAPSEIAQTRRIGISKDTHRMWRFFIKNNPYVS